MNSNSKNQNLDSLLLSSQKTGWIPGHDCSKNLKIISQTHSVNSRHNIIIAQTKQCKICGKKFEESNPDGIK